MDREQIEQEAASYVEDILGLDYIGEAEAKKSFIAGASWRINSVWHNESEEPNLGDLVIVIRPNGRIFDFGFWGVKDKIREGQLWARMYDLIPEKKEAEQ